MPLRVGNPGRPGRAEGAPPGLSRSQLCNLCWPALLRRPLAVRLDRLPTLTASLGRIQRGRDYPRVTPCGLSNRARRTPRFVAGVVPPRRSPSWGVIQETRDRLFPGARLCSQGAVMACGSGFSQRTPALAWKKSSIRRKREC